MTIPSSSQQPTVGQQKSDLESHDEDSISSSQHSEADQETDPPEAPNELTLLGTLLSKDERTGEEQQALDQLLERHGPDVALAIRRTTTSAFQGPLPPPSILRGYEDVVPGAAAKIVDWADSERTHRHRTETTIVHAETTRDLRGQVLAAIVALAGFGVAGLALLLDHAGVAALITAMDIGGMVTAFIYGRRNNDE